MGSLKISREIGAPVALLVQPPIDVITEHDEASDHLSDDGMHVVSEVEERGNVQVQYVGSEEEEDFMTGSDDFHEAIEEALSMQPPDGGEEDLQWSEMAAYAMSRELTVERASSRSPSREEEEEERLLYESKLSEREVRKLIRGKTMEALSFVMGNKRVKTVEYGHIAMTINSYARRLQEHVYPCYTTLLYKSMRTLRSAILISQVEVEADVDTRRAGVMQRYVIQEQRGERPSIRLSVVPPSEWGRRDALAYDYLHTDNTSPRGYPVNLKFKYSPLVFHDVRTNFLTFMHEEYVEDGMYRTGMWIESGSRVAITINDSRAMDLLRHSTAMVIDDNRRRPRMVLQATLGNTVFCNGAEQGDYINACDAVTNLSIDGRVCREGQIIHKFTPRAGVCSLFLHTSATDGQLNSLRVSCITLASQQNAGNGREIPFRPSFGRLQDGRAFTIMRCLLYTDDFKPYGYRQSSFGGCYILPVEIPPWERKGVNSIRILGLTPAGVSSNNVVNAIVSDIAKASSDGVNVEMPDGTTQTLFLDVVGYVGDYQAMVHLLDVTGVNGLAPCNFCTFHRARTSESDGSTTTTRELSSYAYSCAIHSGNLSYRRTKERMAQFRKTARPADLQRIGLRNLSDDEVDELPLHRLSNALESVRDRVP